MKRLGFAWIVVTAVGCGPISGTDTGGGGTDSSSGGATQTQSASSTQATVSAGSTSDSTAGTSSADGTTTASTGLDTGKTDSGGGQIECAVDADCKLDNDCCGCNALPADERLPPCPADCAQGMCDAYGVEQAVCRFGVCTVQKLSCNPQNAECAMPPPSCDEGTTAQVANGCWTGACVAVELCDWVPDCNACTEEEVCVHLLGGPMPVVEQRVCEPIPAACNGVPTCACIGDTICEGIGTCMEEGDKEIACVGK